MQICLVHCSLDTYSTVLLEYCTTQGSQVFSEVEKTAEKKRGFFHLEETGIFQFLPLKVEETGRNSMF